MKEDTLPSEIITEAPIDPSTTSQEPDEEVAVSAVAVDVSEAVSETPQIPEENIDPSPTTPSAEIVPSEDVKAPEDETAAPIEQVIIELEERKKEESETAPTPAAATTVYEGDLGQGTLEDKELYTTRE